MSEILEQKNQGGKVIITFRLDSGEKVYFATSLASGMEIKTRGWFFDKEVLWKADPLDSDAFKPGGLFSEAVKQHHGFLTAVKETILQCKSLDALRTYIKAHEKMPAAA